MTETQAIRRRLEQIIEQALAMLDQLDGDPDLEPYLAWTGDGPSRRDCPGDDREDDGDLDEPWLGWCRGGPSFYDSTDDREEDPADRAVANAVVISPLSHIRPVLTVVR